jgi:hypothetical protein
VTVGGTSQTRISIFLNVFDVHVNRSPIAGVIRDVRYQRGKFVNAMSAHSAEENEQNIVTVEGDGRMVIFKQIAGLIARRPRPARRSHQVWLSRRCSLRSRCRRSSEDWRSRPRRSVSACSFADGAARSRFRNCWARNPFLTCEDRIICEDPEQNQKPSESYGRDSSASS